MSDDTSPAAAKVFAPSAAATCCGPAALPSDIDAAVGERYSRSARETTPQLCAIADGGPDPALLAAIPADVVARDYGCGNPTVHVREGETVLDLGSGSGKACFVAAQIAGPRGRVIGVDRNDDMLALARGAQPQVAARIGFDNVRFLKARIEDLALDRDALDRHLAQHPVRDEAGFAELERWMAEQRAIAPLVPSGSVDLVISNCVLNLVLHDAKRRLFAEIARVLRPGGRAIISDIVSDMDVPEHLQRDPTLWTSCASGALREDRFLRAFEEAGLREIELLARAAQPWQVVDGVAFRSVTVRAVKPQARPEPFLVASAAKTSCCGTESCC